MNKYHFKKIIIYLFIFIIINILLMQQNAITKNKKKTIQYSFFKFQNSIL